MAQKKAHEVETWLARPDGDITFVLVYGPDRGLVAERAQKFAASTEMPLDDPFAVLKIDAADLAGDAGRLIDEAHTVPMFGERRLIWLRHVGNDRAIVDALKMLAEAPPAETTMLIEATDLKKGSALRTLMETAKSAMALPCYADDNRGIDAVIDQSLSGSDKTISLEARQLLKAFLGGDRLATRGELEKLLLYCHGRERIEQEDVEAAIGDAASISQDAVVDMVFAGDTGGFDLAYNRLIASGAHPFAALSAMMRQMQALQIMRFKLDSGGGRAAAVVASARPPVFFSRRRIMESALVRWSAPAITRALARLQETTLATRTNADLASTMTHHLMLSLCLESARLGRR